MNKKRSARLTTMVDVLTGLVLIGKGTSKLSHPEGYWPVIVVSLCGAALILVGTIFHKRLQKAHRFFEPAVALVEGVTCFFVAIASTEHGTHYIQYAWFISAFGFAGAAAIKTRRQMKALLTTAALAVAVAILSPALHAQWEKRPNPGVPRLANGQPDTTAPTPRLANGKPDLSGLWTRAPGDGRGGRGRGANATPQTPPPPPPPGPPVATFGDLGTNMPDGLPMTPWAAELKKQRVALNSKENPDANCLPMGFTQFHQQPQPREIVQLRDKMLILYEANYGLRQIYTDGRTLPRQGDPQPQWYGYSVGHWDGDTLVVETNNLRGAEDSPFDGWLDVRGSPYSRSARFTERFTRPTFGRLEIDVTVDDPTAYTKPFTVRINQQILADTELIEFVCNENQQFRRRVKID